VYFYVRTKKDTVKRVKRGRHMVGKQLSLKKKVPSILRVTPLDGYRLNIEFGSGSILKLNMENRLHTVRYYPLNNLQVFCSATTDGSKIIFDTRPKFELDIFAQEAVNMALMPKGGDRVILRVQPLERYRIWLELKSDSILELNMENRLNTIRYRPLKHLGIFQSVTTDGTNLLFGDVLQMDGEELMKLVLTAF
jgi:hypothetical protein